MVAETGGADEPAGRSDAYESTFSSLWRYARAEKVEAIENYSTEALAASIRSDWRPFVELLRDCRLLELDAQVSDVTVVTQRPIGRGALDLAAVVIGPAGSREVWLEVKIGSGINGDQVERYLAEAERQRERGLPTTLAFLLKYPLSDYLKEVPIRIPWRDVAAAASRASGAAFLWRDLAKFLEDEGVTDDYDSPITSAEADALLSGASLMRKLRRRLRHVGRAASQEWPLLTFPDDRPSARRYVEEQFRNHARLTLGTQGYRAAVLFGLVQRDTSIGLAAERPQLAVWIDHDPRKTDVRRLLIDQARRGGLDEAWIVDWKGHWALRRHVDWDAVGDPDAWWRERFGELDRAGLIALLPELGQVRAEEEAQMAEIAEGLGDEPGGEGPRAEGMVGG